MRVKRQHLIPVLFFSLCSIVFLSSAMVSEAQFGGINTAPTLSADPQYPGANTEVTVSLNAYAVNTASAAITWYVDGTEYREFKNERSIKVMTGKIGSTKTIRAVISPSSGAQTSIDLVLRASEIDIIIEADTNVPSFYRGRPLPSSGAPVRVIAIPNLGSTAAPGSYTYKWELDRKALFGGPVLGKNVIEMNMPTYDGALLSVSIFNSSGDIIARRSTRLSVAEPEAHFYEENPLRGLSQRAIGDTFTLVGEEATIKAEPYFVNKGLAGATRIFEWRLNGQIVENPSDDPYAITLRKTGGSGNAQVSFRLSNSKELLQYATGSFNVFFE